MSYRVCCSKRKRTARRGKLPSTWSAQTAELHALIRACELYQGKAVNLFTDSKYAYRVAHAFGNYQRKDGY